MRCIKYLVGQVIICSIYSIYSLGTMETLQHFLRMEGGIGIPQSAANFDCPGIDKAQYGRLFGKGQSCGQCFTYTVTI
ncbi:hypothetical protein SDC9_146071 [bioreactor metagenome]|uniref:Uncharacterized protein n=1 Tax=bioreactor metagenome TaxID=1076179 RepID=A0A645EC17_9ZZZZ